MYTAMKHSLNKMQPIDRSDILTMVQTALKVEEYRFARQTALAWLASFPGDLGMNFLLAQAFYKEGKINQARPILENICQIDPEYNEALELREAIQNPTRIKTMGVEITVSSAKDEGKPAFNPQKNARIDAIQKHIQAKEFDPASDLIQKTLMEAPDAQVPAILQLRVLDETHNYTSLSNLANHYHQHWPECLHFTLYLAKALMESGDESQAVALLHQCLARDASGQVPSRLWGNHHPYRPLWPDRMEISFDSPVPAAVAAVFGWNRLPENAQAPSTVTETASDDLMAGSNQETPLPGNSPKPPAVAAETVNPPPIAESKNAPAAGRSQGGVVSPETHKAIQKELEKIAKKLKRPEISRADGRYPIYVVMTTRDGLEKKYGPQSAAVIESEIQRLVSAISCRPGWSAMAFYPDDPSITTPLGIKPVTALDPWKIKLAVSDLDQTLGKKGQMIGCLLIIGGNEVVPFHCLPNPTDDPDAEIYSDNPYAALDENYFVPEWPVGRLPGDASPDAGLLLKCLRQIADTHSGQAKTIPWWGRLNPFQILLSMFQTTLFQTQSRDSFGYTAAIWRKASFAVFRPIGETRSVLVSPPTQSTNIRQHGLPPAQLGYFNLHGLVDAAEWYGQRDGGSSPTDTEYPVAISPKDISGSTNIPRIVFSEACYGANLKNKAEDQAMALRFLSSGVRNLVGSTTIAYGSVTTPLIGADLMGFHFWKELQQGQPVGVAFQRAKISVAREMHQRQGYLDGEDQKTLLSFILLGDPLTQLDAYRPKGNSKGFLRTVQPSYKTISDNLSDDRPDGQVPAEVLSQVKQIVEQYLPGLKDASCTVTQQVNTTFETRPEGGIPTPKVGAAASTRTVVKLSKQIPSQTHVHPQFARVTLDAQGKVLKLSMSR